MKEKICRELRKQIVFGSLRPNQGATVREPSAQEVEDYYNLLAILEGKAVQWATPNPTNSDIKQLETINNSLKEVIKTSETAAEDWIPLNMEFHRLFSWIAPS